MASTLLVEAKDLEMLAKMRAHPIVVTDTLRCVKILIADDSTEHDICKDATQTIAKMNAVDATKLALSDDDKAKLKRYVDTYDVSQVARASEACEGCYVWIAHCLSRLP